MSGFDLNMKNVSPEVQKMAEPKLEALKKATQGFEAIFLKKLFGEMRSSVKETPVGDSFGKDIYDDMFNEAIANDAAKNHSMGMGSMLYKQFAPRVIAEAQRDFQLQKAALARGEAVKSK